MVVVRQRLLTAQSRQKSYADVRRKDLEFAVGDYVWLKISPMKGVVHFGKRGKLSPRYIGPFEILSRVGSSAYQLALPLALSVVHNIFHVLILRKYVPDISHGFRFDYYRVADSHFRLREESSKEPDDPLLEGRVAISWQR